MKRTLVLLSFVFLASVAKTESQPATQSNSLVGEWEAVELRMDMEVSGTFMAQLQGHVVVDRGAFDGWIEDASDKPEGDKKDRVKGSYSLNHNNVLIDFDLGQGQSLSMTMAYSIETRNGDEYLELELAGEESMKYFLRGIKDVEELAPMSEEDELRMTEMKEMMKRVKFMLRLKRK